jgi:hypothetical protein
MSTDFVGGAIVRDAGRGRGCVLERNRKDNGCQEENLIYQMNLGKWTKEKDRRFSYDEISLARTY